MSGNGAPGAGWVLAQRPLNRLDYIDYFFFASFGAVIPPPSFGAKGS